MGVKHILVGYFAGKLAAASFGHHLGFGSLMCLCFRVLRGARLCSVMIIYRRGGERPNEETTEWPGSVL